MNKQINKKFFARKRFGQKFLTNLSIVNNIITAFNPKPDQAIVEIGPGLGALTLPICEKIKNMIAIELDRNLTTYLSKNIRLKNKLIIIQKNALTVDFRSIAKQKGKPLRVFGNLPYNISTPLIFHLFSFKDSISDMTFMLQKEVVNRLIAKPNTKSYGRLSVMGQYYCQIIPIINVPPSSFTPTPKVDSMVAHFIPYQENPYPICDVKLLNHIATQAFNQRRKKIHNSLNNLFKIQDFVELGIDPNSRAENISVENYCKLAYKFSKSQPNNDRFGVIKLC